MVETGEVVAVLGVLKAVLLSFILKSSSHHSHNQYLQSYHH